MRQSTTAVLERNVRWQGAFELEPYETAWAGEAIYFVRTLESSSLPAEFSARVQISPDGMNWCDEGSQLPIVDAPGVSFCRLTNFGGWLRVVGELPVGASAKVIVYLALKE
ncbi:MAG: hypothetical protein HC802_09925 [Caldilineaceae bacterium]|nr:hypothetical protein [Caldilineaceae bacterium]